MRANKFSKLNKIRYKDLAIAVALSGASLLLVPTTAQADSTNTAQTDQESSSVVQTKNSTTDSNLFKNTTVGSITPNLSDIAQPTINTNTQTTNSENNSNVSSTTNNQTITSQNNSSASSTTSIPTTNNSPVIPESSALNNTSTENSTSSATAVATKPMTQTTTSTETTDSNNTTSDSQSISYALTGNDKLAPAAVIPDRGISIKNVPDSTAVNGKYAIKIQAVNNYGTAYGSPKIVGYYAPGQSVTINWDTHLNFLLSQSMGQSVSYGLHPWYKDYDSEPLNIDMNNNDVLISVYYSRPAASINFVFVDETSGKILHHGFIPYSFYDHANFQTLGIRPPMDVMSNGKLTPGDQSQFKINNVDILPYFGPTGMIYNNSYLVLDLAKSGNVTPMDYLQWPTGDFTKTFYYKEVAAPTVTVDAVDQFGDLLKTFSNSQMSDDPSVIHPNVYLPSSSATIIPNNTLIGINLIKSDSVSGQPDETTSYQMTPAQYANYMETGATTDDYETRLLGDYQHLEIQLSYQIDTEEVYVQPVDPVGNKVGDPIPVGAGSIGKNMTIMAPTVSGYAPQVASVSITVQPDQGPVEFPYISATDIDPSHGGTYLYEGGFDKLPDNGIVITDTGTASTDPTTEHSIGVQAVDTNGNPLGAVIPVTTSKSNTTALLNWSDSLIDSLNNSVKNVSQYQLWNPDALAGSLSVPVKTQDVVVDVIYALPKVTTTYNFVDINTGKNLLTETNTWDLNDPNNGYTYKTDGLRPPMTVIDPDSGQLVVSDPSDDPVTDPADLPFFGPSGTVFNTGAYQLNSLMSGLTTPTRYIKWPSANVTQTFYYMEEPDPTMTIDAADQNGNIIKTFSAPTIVSTLPAPQLSQADYFPTAAQATVNGYTLTGFKLNATGSYFGGSDTDYSYSMTPDEYAQFISSPSAQTTMDERALAAHQNFHIQLTYQGNTVDLMIQPVDENGVKIGDPISAGSGIVGSSATLTAPEIANYQAITPTSSIVVAPDQGSIDVTYKKVTTTQPSTSGSSSTGSITDSGNTGSTSASGSTDSGSSSSTTDPVNSGSSSTTTSGSNTDSGSTGSTSTSDSSTTDPNTSGSGSSTSSSNSGSGNSGSTSTSTSGSSTTDPNTSGSGSSTSSSNSGSGNSGSTSTSTSGSSTTGSNNSNTGSSTSSSDSGSDSGNTGSTSTSTSGSSSTDPATSGSNTDPVNTGSGSSSSGSSDDPGNTSDSSSTTTNSGSTGTSTGSTSTSTSGAGTSSSTTDPVNSGSPSTTTSGSNTDPGSAGSTSTSTSGTGNTDPNTSSSESSTTSSTTDPVNSGSSSTTTSGSNTDSGNSGSTATSTAGSGTTDPNTSSSGSSTSSSNTDPVNSGSSSTTISGSNTDSGNSRSTATSTAGSGTTDPNTSSSGSSSTDPASSSSGSGTSSSTTDPVNSGSSSTTTSDSNTDSGNSGSSSTNTNTSSSGSSSTDPASSNSGSSTSSSTTDPVNSGSSSTTTSGSNTDSGNSGSKATSTTGSSTTDPNTSSSNTTSGNSGSGSGSGSTSTSGSSSTDPNTSGSGSASTGSTGSDSGSTSSTSGTTADPGNASSSSCNTGSTADPVNSGSDSGSTSSSTDPMNAISSDPTTSKAGYDSTSVVDNSSDQAHDHNAASIVDPNASTITGNNSDPTSISQTVPAATNSTVVHSSSSDVTAQQSGDKPVPTTLRKSSTTGISQQDRTSNSQSDNSIKSPDPESTSKQTALPSNSTKNVSGNNQTESKVAMTNTSNLRLSNSDLSSKLPQTGNKFAGILSAIGIAMLGILAFCGKKIKKLF